MTFAAEMARVRPDEIALRDATNILSWAEVDDRLRPAVNALLDENLRERRRVAVLASNSVETMLAYATCALAGAAAVAANCHLTSGELEYLFRDGEVDVVLSDAEHAAVARTAATAAGVPAVIAWGDEPDNLPDGVVAWSQWCARAGDSEPPTDRPPRRTLVYTSGTTGRPKGVELPPTSWVGGDDIDEHLRRLRGNRLVDKGRHLVVGPMYHSGPLTSTRLFLAGTPVTIVGKFDAEKVLEAIDRDRIGSSIMVPTHFQRLLELPAEVRDRYDHSSLEYVLQVGAKCPERVKRSMIEWWGPILWESYGASEVGTTCMISAAEWLERPGSVGKAVPPFSAFILDANGDPVPPDTEGLLWFRDSTGHGISYISDTDADGRRDGSFTLGEIGRMDAEGYVWVTDRASDMVVSGGVNIYPAETEQALMRHPDVLDVACYGVADDAMGERLVALVAPAPTAPAPTAAQLDAYCHEHLAGYKCPKEFRFVTQVPRNAVGKIDKRSIRAKHDSASRSLA